MLEQLSIKQELMNLQKVDKELIQYNERKIQEGEYTLIKALEHSLDNSWTIYYEPYLNGLRPDIIIFSPKYGIGIFEVKDWNLNSYCVKTEHGNSYNWLVRNKNGMWQKISEDKQPFKQIKKYKDNIVDRELPILRSQIIVYGDYLYGSVKTFVYFHNHSSNEITSVVKPIISNIKYHRYFGQEQLNNFKSFLNKYLIVPSIDRNYEKTYQRDDVNNRVKNALRCPQAPENLVKKLSVKLLNKKQRDLLPNTSGCRKVRGEAGSGKTITLIHKAVEGANQDKKVLIVCYNITMNNYIQDCVKCLARAKYPNQFKRIISNIETGHFHSFFGSSDDEDGVVYCDPKIDKRNKKEKVDIILIDEGQDFRRAWIERLQQIGNDGYHLMYFEDVRQNIYGIDEKEREAIPNMPGAYNILNRSYRLSSSTAKLANLLIERSHQEGSLETNKVAEQQSLILEETKNYWFNGDMNQCLNLLKQDIASLVNDNKASRSDIVILINIIEDGWKICQKLDELNLPYQCTFESEEENRKTSDKDIMRLRRGYKKGFWLQTGKIKVATVHCFKGWELENVFFFSNYNEKQQKQTVEFLYTAITRSEKNLTVYNIDKRLYEFGQYAISKNYVQKHPILH